MPKKRSRRMPKGCYDRNGVIWFRATVKGFEHRFSLHTNDVAVAEREAEKHRTRLTAEAYGGAWRRGYKEAVVAWGEHLVTHVAASTAKRYVVSLGQMEAVIRDLMVDEIDSDIVAKIVKVRRQAGASTATIRRDLTALSSLLRFAQEEKWTKDNPALERLQRLRERRDPITLPDDADILRVVERAPPMFAAMIRFALETGCRQEEIAGAEWRMIKAGEFTLVGKGSKRRTLELRPEAQAVLDGLQPRLRCPFVFWHGDGERFANVSSRFAAIAKAAQQDGTPFRPFRFHDLRHRFAVDRLKDGWGLYDVQRYLGHSSIKTTEIYLAHLTADQEKAAMGGSAQIAAHRVAVSRVP